MNIVQPSYPMFKNEAPRSLTDITDLIIHHSAGSLFQTPQDIDAEHRARGMSGIGYNYIINPSGVVFYGRPANVIPAAAYGRNQQSLNICVIGNFHPSDAGYTGKPTPSQINALTELSVYLHHKYPSIIRTIGHRQVATLFHKDNPGDYSTACPGDDLFWLIPEVNAKVSKALATL